MTLDSDKQVVIGGQVIGQLAGGFTDYDGLIETLRARIVAAGLSYRVLEEIAGLPEGGATKYLSDTRARHFSVDSLLQISEALGIRGMFVTDDALLRQMQPLYEKRDERKAHAHRRAPLGATTLRRVRPAVLSELGRKGAAARNAKLSPALRSELARLAARARWQNRISRFNG
jgi:hypothetical protein